MSHRLSSDAFARYFATFEREIFRLETLDLYRTPEEGPSFERFLSGDPFPPQINEEWCGFVREKCATGRRIGRVHAVTMPLSPYVEFEMRCGYRFSVDVGETVSLIDRQRLPAAFAAIGDFWLFDAASLVRMEYDDGRFVSGILETSEELLRAVLKAVRTLPGLAEPIQTFLHPAPVEATAARII